MNQPTREEARRYRLHIRAQIRKRNHLRPRCASCGCDMPVFDVSDIITEEQMDKPGYWYLREADFRPGDLVCIWCIWSEIGAGDDAYIWGHA
jgi:hypothetical protein